ncbi:cell division ATP-binding protein FtsE [Cellulosilyticum sp. ST5]|uniref:Cell division ATP-binding protein FtsE n=1 Tax=Cellulosilyticum lentocellum (strain ATCC 49066 / DSM 5427 / NCIMB 11756 / RHM5) TaxID=642492 RepID=F2JSE3_CELLD|nr:MULTISPECIES: cell division ATP-binding protein FtsE [Cellulosilyticum]ADZ85181.1 cell division ATP-binding protein FtsE [Cellulosilyticum lentocellum DSM 5427]QEH70739.1 cell division ATP-binding protein FtsE [Cellulosilyticum sp. WCF-2]
MIQLQGVSKVYSNGAVGLNNVSLTIEKGEFVFITGNSGSGKSTFLRLLFKEIDPDHGKIIINNKDISKLKRRQIPYLRRDLGMVFQDFRLLPNKTVYENVAFAMQIVGATSREIRKNVPIVLGLVGLARKARCYPNELSGGEQQRTALARAIVNNNPILIADEPTGNLDPATSWEIMNCLQDINRRGVTIIMATHEREIVNTLKKRVIEISNGQISKDVHEGGYDDEVEYSQVFI